MSSPASRRMGRAQLVISSLDLDPSLPKIPAHVVFRVSALVGGEEIIFGDASVSESDVVSAGVPASRAVRHVEHSSGRRNFSGFTA